MPRVQVMYCGGCREAYDRKEWLGHLHGLLRERLQDDVEFCHAPCPDGAMRLILFGCTAACLAPDKSAAASGVPEHSIGPDGYFDGVTRTVEEIARTIARELQGAEQ